YAPSMTPDRASELAEVDSVKEDEVLEREGMEEELMQQGRSEVGEHISDVDTETEG
ncbi:MAG: hypothetical protein QOE93_708, partial [Actinomycetota bacterium]|nr:hypothetical protein [Actinomycetota bacterium]